MAIASDRVRIAGAAVLIAALMLALLAGAPLVEPASAQTADRIDRLSGPDRFATAADASADSFDPAEVDVVYVATGLDFADALAAGVVAARNAAPVLLTLPELLPDPTRDELRRLAPARVVVVGGSNAVGPRVMAEIEDAVDGVRVSRVSGANRFDTAARLALANFDAATTSRAFVATGLDFPDALAAVPAAFAEEAPLILVARSGIPAEAADALAALDLDEIVIVGGTGAIDSGVESELRAHADTVSRVQGGSHSLADPGTILPPDRFGTAAAVAQRSIGEASTLYIATGLAFPDALAGGPIAAIEGGALILVATETVIPDTVSEIVRLNPRRVKILGGQNAISNAVIAQLRDILGATIAVPSGETGDLAFSTGRDLNRAGGTQGIAIGALDGSASMVTQPPPGWSDVFPVYVDDGVTIAFIRQPRRGSGNDVAAVDSEVWTVDTRIGPRSAQNLAVEGLEDCFLGIGAFAGANGRMVVDCFRAVDDGDDRPEREVVLIDTATGATTPITRGDEVLTGTAALSPDGEKVALQRFELDADGQIQEVDLLVLNLDDVAGTPLATYRVPWPDFADQPVWDDAGQTVAFMQRDTGPGSLVIIDLAEPNDPIIRFDGDPRPYLTAGFIDDHVIVIRERDLSSDPDVTTDEVHLVPRDGTPEVIIDAATLQGDNNLIARVEPTPDRDALLYNQGVDGGGGRISGGSLWTIGLDGADNTLLDFPGSQVEGVFPRGASPWEHPR